MPELPDVELFKRHLDSNGLHKTVEEVDIRSEQVLGNLRSEELKSILPGKKFNSSLRQPDANFTKCRPMHKILKS